MRRLTAIMAVNEQGVIGKDNALPWRIRSDLRFFRRQTVTNIVIMGRNTWHSLGKCLPDRKNIVVTHDAGLFEEQPACRIADGVEKALALAATIGAADDEVFVIGGAAIYAQFAPYVDRYLITEVRKPVENADSIVSPSLLGAVNDWAIARIESGSADEGAGDEADFAIFSLTHRNADTIARRREAAISAAAERNP